MSSFRVVELGNSVAAAAGGAQLAALGMEVIKVEGLNGDPSRSIANPSVKTHLSRGKKTVCFDFAKLSLTNDEGVELRNRLLRLVSSADIFLVSMPAHELAELGVDWKSLQAQCPNLCFLHVSPRGYGKGGWHGFGAEFLPFYAGSGLLDLVRSDARVPFEDAALPPQLVPFFGEHATSYHILVGAAGVLFSRQSGHRGQKVEVTLEAASIHTLSPLLNTLWYMQVTDGVDTINDMAARFPYKHRGVDKNTLRVHGGVVLPSMQVFECSDGLWIQLLELDMMEPLDRIQCALDAPNADSVKRTAIWDAIFCTGPILERILYFLKAYRGAFTQAFKQIPRDEAMRLLHARGVRHIAVGDIGAITQHPQVMHLGLIQNDHVLSPILMHGCMNAQLNKIASRDGEKDTGSFQALEEERNAHVEK